jgi:hypothetical protein
MNPEDALVAGFREMIRAKRRRLRLRVAAALVALPVVAAILHFAC